MSKEDRDRDKKAQQFDISELRPEHLAGKPRRVGRIGRSPVYRAQTTGGLTLVFVSRDGKNLDGIGAGSHPGIADFIAEKREPTLVWDEFAKSERPPIPEHLQRKYEALTDEFAAAFRARRK